MPDFTVQDLIGTKANGVPITLVLEIRIHMRVAKGRIPSEVAEDIPVTIAGYDRVEDDLPVLGNVHVPFSEQAALEIAEVIEARRGW
jgi:hypothetical protein